MRPLPDVDALFDELEVLEAKLAAEIETMSQGDLDTVMADMREILDSLRFMTREERHRDLS